ncbi:MAG TPA: SAM-dependent methyltransferase [Nannocystis exedens]|nr:SAM-dependent methyltransferase [Nannocystis exedens]
MLGKCRTFLPRCRGVFAERGQLCAEERNRCAQRMSIIPPMWLFAVKIAYDAAVSVGLALSPRLAAIAALVPDGKIVADIGTDHALLPTALVVGGRIKRAIACDRRVGPLAAARRTVAHYGVEDRVSLRLGDGLETIDEGEADVVIIAGMGSESLRSILSAGLDLLPSIERLVLQPNGEVEPVRRWLVSRGWDLVDERLVEDRGRYYTVVAAEAAIGGRRHYVAADWHLGPILRHRGGSLFERFVAAELRRCELALAAVRRAPIPKRRRLAALGATRALLLSELVGGATRPHTC